MFIGYAGVLRRAIAVDDGPHVEVGFSVRLALASFTATQLFSFAGVAGLAVVYWALRRLGRDRDGAAVVLIGLNTCVYLVFGVIGWIAAAAALLTGEALAGDHRAVANRSSARRGGSVVVHRARADRALDCTVPESHSRALGTGVAAAGWRGHGCTTATTGECWRGRRATGLAT